MSAPAATEPCVPAPTIELVGITRTYPGSSPVRALGPASLTVSAG